MKPMYSKVKAVMIAGCIMTLVTWLLTRFAGIEVPADVATACAWIICVAAGWVQLEKVGG
jgi:hypothetical protein